MKRKIVPGLVAILLASVALAAEAAPSTSYYVYDESGHVIGEYDANGNSVQEHIYLGDRPVAVAVTSNNTTTVDYVTTDQLNTPRAITDSSQTVDWSWTSDPFGNGQSTGSLTYNLRFPGQYYDAETVHDYNHYRDYDSGTGRYVESDPLSINGGVNTYIYVKDDPLFDSDAMGLCPSIIDDKADTYLPPDIVAVYPDGNCLAKRFGSRSHKTLLSAGPCTCQHMQTCTYTVFRESHQDVGVIRCKSRTGSAGIWQSGEMTPLLIGQETISMPCK